jgi:hypothetical protein
MITAAEAERRAVMMAAGLEHYGECACGVGASAHQARLYRCQSCGVKVCFTCKSKHVCEVAHAAP